MLDIGLIIAGINFIVAMVILFFVLKIVGKLKGSKLYYTAILFVLTGIFFVIHAAVEIFGFGDTYYALTAFISTIFFSGAIYFARQSTKIVRSKYD